MASTREILRKAFDESRPRVKMSAKTHQRYEDRISKAKDSGKNREALSAMEDIVDKDRYRSYNKGIPYERQRELGLSTPKKPAGPSVSEAYAKRRKRVTSK